MYYFITTPALSQVLFNVKNMKVHLIECSEEACVKTKDCSILIMACGSTMVEQVPHHPKSSHCQWQREGENCVRKNTV